MSSQLEVIRGFWCVHLENYLTHSFIKLFGSLGGLETTW